MESRQRHPGGRRSSSPGDVILIEQQTTGPRWPGGKDSFGYVPVEWQTAAVRSAIRDATERGRIVIEPAANGSQDLDSPYNDLRPQLVHHYDSGAIMVGAGNAPGCRYGTDPTVARGRLSFSNYGSRMDVQGWGSCVVRTGYGGLQGVTGGNAAYTATFGGTSSASPIVAATAAVLSSVAESRGTTLTPSTVRTTLRATGQPQAFGNAGLIGPLPEPARRDRDARTEADRGDTRGQRRQAPGHDRPGARELDERGSAAVRYEVQLKTDEGAVRPAEPSTTAAATFNLERNHSYQFVARGVDAAGIWGDWAEGRAFRVDAYQENYTAANPALTGNWTRWRGSRRPTAS